MIDSTTARTTIGRCLTGAFAACALALAIGVAPAFASSIPELSGDAANVPRSGVPVPVQVSIGQPQTRDIALETIQEYRQEAYDEGIVDLPEGMTEDEYVHGIKWNQDLERVAIQRAIESAVADELAHKRPDGTQWWSATSNGIGGSSEGIAGMGAGSLEGINDIGMVDFMRSNGSAKFGISLWKSEKDAYISNRTKGTSLVAGHYENLIDPAYKSYGLAYVGVRGSEWLKVVVVPSTEVSTTNAKSVGYDGIYDATVYACDSECITVGLQARCKSGVVKVGGSSTIGITASSSLTGADTWEIDPATAGYESSDPSVLTVDEKGVVTGVSGGVATVTVRMGAETTTVDVPVTDQSAAFRLYNPWSGEHFYTLNATERDGLVQAGWTDEGLGWVAPTSKSVPVYRLYNPNAGDHHYTMDAAERDALVAGGWSDEGVGWYSDPSKGVVLYREYNPYAPACNHNYTTDKAEHDSLVSLGWVDEGTAWYGVDVAAQAAKSAKSSVLIAG